MLTITKTFVLFNIKKKVVNDIGYGPKIQRRLRYHLQRLRYRLYDIAYDNVSDAVSNVGIFNRVFLIG